MSERSQPREVLERALKALRLFDTYERMPADRGGKNGPRGRAWQAFVEAKDAVLRAAGDE